MNEKLKNCLTLLQKPKVLIIAGAIGVLLIFLSSLIGKAENKNTYTLDENFSIEDYKENLEENIRDIVKEISGDKKAEVVVTLESSIEYSYADTTEESLTDKSDDKSQAAESQSKNEYIIIKNSDGSEKAVLIKAKLPEIRGVAIVCNDGDNELINLKITNAVTAALNITSKRVYICGRKN